MKWPLMILIACAGILNTIQTGCNSTLKQSTDSPVWSVTAILAVGFATSVLVALLSGQRPPALATLSTVPWWGWIGGVLGTIYILSMVLTADKVGAAVFMGITVTMAVTSSLVMDHFGFMGFDVHRAGVGRIVGGVLMVAGLGLIAKF